jgi:hypothetical protein
MNGPGQTRPSASYFNLSARRPEHPATRRSADVPDRSPALKRSSPRTRKHPAAAAFLGSDFLGAPARDRANVSNLSAFYRDIRFHRRAAGTIDHGTAANNKIEVCHWTLLPRE